MNAAQLMKLFKFLARRSGVPRSTPFSRWSVFAYPVWQDRGAGQAGFKLMAYRGVDSSKMRVAKMVCAHALNCVVAGISAPLEGFNAIGPGVSTIGGKYGGLKDAFNVDIGAIQLSHVLENSDDPNTIGNAIISSGKLLFYAAVRVDRGSDGVKVHVRGDSRPTSFTEWTFQNWPSMHQSTSTANYYVMRNGTTMQGSRIVGNYKTGRS